MRVLVLNCGSATVKYRLYEGAAGAIVAGRGETIDVQGEYRATLGRILDALPWRPDVVGHRVVPPALEGIEAARRLGSPMVACFDTSFHQTLPPRAWRYAIPATLGPELRRYGFHGLSHEYVAQRYAELAGARAPSLVTLHLGGGCSAAAIRDGTCVDTSMGMGPLEGLVMGTRAGDLDPTILVHLLHAGRSLEEIARILNYESGLHALAGTSDMREILARGDDARNRAGGPRISTDDSKLHAYVIRTDEELLIARQAIGLLQGDRAG